jgi:hypothetical protein
MNLTDRAPLTGLQGLRKRSGWRNLPVVSALLFILAASSAAMAGPPVAREQRQVESLSAAEFSRLVRDISEEGGYFRSDNFTSNESSYLHVVDKLRQLGATGGAYIGVGPEQNFTYIAKIRPRIAFIVDIRRQAIIQHLMYKAIFHLSANRTQFISLLLSKPLPKDKAPGADASANELLSFFSQISGDDLAYTANLAAVSKTIQEDFQFPLDETDKSSLDYVYKSFRTEGLDIAYRIDGFRGNSFPTLREIIAETDLSGKQGNFLAVKTDYEFVRDLHLKNMIIPVVGDFGGKKALVAVGNYLRKNKLTVTAFYTSNVEQYLFDGGAFEAFAENVRKLPLTDKSLFIRAAAGRFPHPARMPGHRLTTLLQHMKVFLQDFSEGRYRNYNDLITTNYITAGKA